MRMRNAAKLIREKWIAIMDQVMETSKESVLAIDEAPGDLFHPLAIWLAHDAADLDASSLEVDDEERVEPRQTGERQGLDCEEIAPGNRTGMRLREGAPGCFATALGAGSMPCFARIHLIVFRPTVYPRFCSAPRIRV